MNKAHQVNAVALSMQTMMTALDSAYDAMVGRGQHEIILVVGAGDVVQYSSNTKRDRGVLMLRDLFARWSLGMADRLPGEQTPADTRAFEYLLNTFEAAAQADYPAANDYAAHRTELLTYVGGLIAEINRGKAA